MRTFFALLLTTLTASAGGWWTGWTVTDGGYPGTVGSCSAVTGTFTVPAISGKRLSLDFWVGLDGYANQTVEQIGVELSSKNGVQTCQLWYEMYPKNFVNVRRFPIRAGDSITLSATHDGQGHCLLTARNNTTGQSFSTIQAADPNAEFSSAEWITETWLPAVPRFGTVQWTDCYAQVNGNPVLFLVNENPNTIACTPLVNGAFTMTTTF